MSDPLNSTSEVQLAVIGGGKMGEALLGGMLRAGSIALRDVLVVEPDTDRRAELGDAYPGLAVVAEVPARLRAAGVLVAVKPQHVEIVCRQIAPGAGRILSIAAGVTASTIERSLAEGAPGRAIPVVRAMPNTPALVGVGASAIAAGSSAGADDLAWAEGVLCAVGIVVRVDEKQLDAVTGLSGSGPAYIFLVAEAMIEAGVLLGLTRPIARALVAQTIRGAGTLLTDSSEDAATLRGNVTSPGGTTAAGLRALEAAGMRSALIDAVAAATRRATELG